MWFMFSESHVMSGSEISNLLHLYTPQCRALILENGPCTGSFAKVRDGLLIMLFQHIRYEVHYKGSTIQACKRDSAILQGCRYVLCLSVCVRTNICIQTKYLGGRGSHPSQPSPSSIPMQSLVANWCLYENTDLTLKMSSNCTICYLEEL